MKIRNLILIFHLLALGSIAQSTPDMAAFQKSVKGDLTKNAPAAASVSFDGCKMTLKLTSGEYVTVLKDVTGNRERDLNPMKEPVSTSRPGEEAARNLSSGAGEDYSTVQTDTFWIDLTIIDPTGIVAGTQKSGKYVPFSIASSRDRMAISRKVNGKLIGHPTLTFNIKDSVGPRVVDALKQIATACSSQKPLSN